MFQRIVQGVDLATLIPDLAVGQMMPPEGYGKLFKLVQERGGSDPIWIEAKKVLGRDIAHRFLQAWVAQRRKPARILATGAGEAWTEGVWVEEGHDVTIHDGTDELFPTLRERYPKAKFALADMATFAPREKFDVITLISNDCVLNRHEFNGFLERMAASLTPRGWIICYCPSTLSLRRIAIELLRGSTAYHSRHHWVRWGWWRTPSEFRRAAKNCGLKVVQSMVHNGKDWSPSRAMLPPLAQCNSLYLLGKIQ